MQRLQKAALAASAAAIIVVVAGAAIVDRPILQHASPWKLKRAPVAPIVTLETEFIVAYMPMYPFNGTHANDRFGCAVSGAGDVNGDGYADILVGSAKDGSHGVEAGSVRVLSGFDGTTLYTLYGASPRDWFGYSVSNVADLDGDGATDFIVGIPYDDEGGVDAGAVQLVSGADGAVIAKFPGDLPGGRLGLAVSRAGDVNNDGVKDFIAGTWAAGLGGISTGAARVYSGMTGEVLYTFFGEHPYACFGKSVSGAGDVNRDGYADLIIGCPNDDPNGPDSGSALVYSGYDGSVMYIFEGDGPGDMLGESVAWAGDVDRDGHPDLIVGAWFDDKGGDDAGMVRVYSGRTGEILHSLYGSSPGACFGYAVAGAGDVDLDGFNDLIVGSVLDATNGVESGSVCLISGASGKVLYTLDGDSPYDHFGCSVGTAGDINNDGLVDFVVGALDDDNSGNASGSARVILSLKIEVPADCPGDLTGDRVVDFNDLTSLLGNFGQTCN